MKWHCLLQWVLPVYMGFVGWWREDGENNWWLEWDHCSVAAMQEKPLKWKAHGNTAERFRDGSLCFCRDIQEIGQVLHSSALMEKWRAHFCWGNAPPQQLTNQPAWTPTTLVCLDHQTLWKRNIHKKSKAVQFYNLCFCLCSGINGDSMSGVYSTAMLNSKQVLHSSSHYWTKCQIPQFHSTWKEHKKRG